MLLIYSGIKIIKMYCWEEPFKKLVKQLRTKEIKYQACLHSLSAVNSLFENDLSCFITYLSVTVFVYFMKIPFVPSYLVFAMGYYSRLCTTVGFYLSRAITMCMSALVSLGRFQEFLLFTEFKSDTSSTCQSLTLNEPIVKVSHMYASWSKDFEDGFCLNNLTFTAEQNQLVAIVGPTGAGKSSLLLALMREMETIKGHMEMRGSVFYVAQGTKR